MLRSYKSLSTLQWALGLSVLLHAVLLTVRFVDPEGFKRLFQETTLDVVLVNAASDEKPVKAQAIAQSSLAGGGEAAARCHIARTVVRRAERRTVELARLENVRPQPVQYLNRLSDLLFVLCRVLARASGHGEVLWKHERRK